MTFSRRIYSQKPGPVVFMPSSELPLRISGTVPTCLRSAFVSGPDRRTRPCAGRRLCVTHSFAQAHSKRIEPASVYTTTGVFRFLASSASRCIRSAGPRIIPDYIVPVYGGRRCPGRLFQCLDMRRFSISISRELGFAGLDR